MYTSFSFSFIKLYFLGPPMACPIPPKRKTAAFKSNDPKKFKATIKTSVYPWDRSSLKSLEMDLQTFAKLDAYASKVEAKSNVEDLVKVLLQEARTELEKIRAIWIWICHNIGYEIVGSNDKEVKSSDEDDILKKKKEACEGYSGLLCQMCSVAGVQCLMLSGHAKGHGYRIGQKYSGDSNHMWNAVYLAGKWHLLDSTWGAGNVNDNCTQFMFDYNELYFLTHPALFVEDHFPEDPDWQMLSKPLSITEFENNIRHDKGFYNMGLLGSSPNTPVIKTVNGKSVITLDARAATLFVFDLNGKETPGVLALRRFGMKLEVYPQATGSHTLQIFAKPWNSSKSIFSRALIHILECNSVDNTMKLPTDLHNPVGPSWLTEEKGFLQPSHPDPIIPIQDGRCSISFTVKGDMDTLATLHTDVMPMNEDIRRRHIFKSQKGNRIVIQIQLPQAGYFVLKIFSKTKGGESKTFSYALNYLLSCSNAAVKWPVFPRMYGSWLEGYELVEPTSGILPDNQNIHFKLKVPGVSKVFVKDKKSGSLTLSADGYWEGNFNTAGSQDANVIIQQVPDKNLYATILKYTVDDK
ncbi:kyphoscoliosis peptidase-like [Ambystoma mexicanum]|uniref:kyphoscoliosis peptidase-like n=1 Tax=Ambystoma mexicanum TaxID=8296 RepID=UPI0037E79BFA